MWRLKETISIVYGFALPLLSAAQAPTKVIVSHQPIGAASWDSSGDPQNKGVNVLDQVQSGLRALAPVTINSRIFPGLPGVGDADYETGPEGSGITLGVNTFNYMLPEGGQYYYQFALVPAGDVGEKVQRLSSIDHSRLYGCFDRRRAFMPEIIEHACRYVRSIELDRGQFTKILDAKTYAPLSAEDSNLIDRLRSLSDADRKLVTPEDGYRWRSLHIVSGHVGEDGQTTWEPEHFPRVPYRFGPLPEDLIDFPTDLYLTVRDQQLLKIWLDCSVRVNQNQLPITKPDHGCRPIALQTTTNLYLALQRKDFANNAGGWGTTFSHKAFDIRGTKDPSAAASVVAKTFVGYLTENFKRRPIEALIDTSEGMPPREFEFKREFQWSFVLNTGFKGPYFERSAYLVQWWTADPWTSPYDLREPHGGDFYVHVSHSLQIGKTANGEFPDPTPDQEAEYKRLVQGLIADAIGKTTTKLGGTMDGMVGVFTGDLK